jgi:hypothetical protein
MFLSEFSPCFLGIDIGHALQPSKILSLFIKRNVPHSPLSSAFFLVRDLIISVFVSSHMDSLDLSSIVNIPPVLDCLPSIVRKFWSSPLVAWKYVKTSGQEFFSYREMGRSVHADKVQKNMLSGCNCNCFPMFVNCPHGHVISANLDILSRLVWLNSFLEAQSSAEVHCLTCLLKKLLRKV